MTRPRFLGVALLPLLLLLGGCQLGVPEELPVAQKLQGEALERVDQGRRLTILAYDKEMRRLYDQMLDSVERYELEKAAGAGTTVPVATAQRIAKQKSDQRAAIHAQLDAKRDEFLNDANVDIAKRLHGTVDRWMQVYITDFALRVQKLIAEGKTLFNGEQPAVNSDFSGTSKETP